MLAQVDEKTEFQESQMLCLLLSRKVKTISSWDMPGGSVAKALKSQSKGPLFKLWSENWIPHAVTKAPVYHN